VAYPEARLGCGLDEGQVFLQQILSTRRITCCSSFNAPWGQAFRWAMMSAAALNPGLEGIWEMCVFTTANRPLRWPGD
jgi:hypothetical protein